MESITIVKVGGAVVEDKDGLEGLLDRFGSLEGRKILVHGGGRRATKMAAALGMESRMVDGRRVTDRGMLDVVTMVYGGLINKNIVAGLQARGINAAGLTGADMDVMRADKRKARNGVDYGFVGDVRKVDVERLKALVDAGLTPVMAPLTHDGQGNMLNTNADTIASETAKALVGLFDVTLVFCFEKKGVLRNPDDDDSVMPSLTRKEYELCVAQGIVTGGMMPKIENALAAVDAGVKRVIITKADELGTGQGTVITL